MVGSGSDDRSGDSEGMCDVGTTMADANTLLPGHACVECLARRLEGVERGRLPDSSLHTRAGLSRGTQCSGSETQGRASARGLVQRRRGRIEPVVDPLSGQTLGAGPLVPSPVRSIEPGTEQVRRPCGRRDRGVVPALNPSMALEARWRWCSTSSIASSDALSGPSRVRLSRQRAAPRVGRALVQRPSTSRSAHGLNGPALEPGAGAALLRQHQTRRPMTQVLCKPRTPPPRATYAAPPAQSTPARAAHRSRGRHIPAPHAACPSPPRTVARWRRTRAARSTVRVWP